MREPILNPLPAGFTIAPSLPRQIYERRGRQHPFLLALFLIVNTLTISLPSLGLGGVPIRAAVSLIIIFYIFTVYNRIFTSTVIRHKIIIILFALFSFLGTVVSLANATPIPTIVRQITEIHVQSTLNLLIAASLVELCGPVSVLWMFALPIGVSVIFAFGQALGVDAAWAIRNSLGALQHEVVDKSEIMEMKARPLGLSFSPIALATQLCLLFAGYGIIRDRLRTIYKNWSSIDLRLMVAAVAFIGACLLSGNRSPILGMSIFIIFYVARQKPIGFWLVILPIGAVIVALLGPSLLEALQGSGSRVVSVEDKSAMGRIALYYYGILLFVNHPVGYGLDFDPTMHWQEHWDKVSSLPNAATVQNFPLHNYILSMLNFYGIGIILILPFIYLFLKKYNWALIYLIPYAMHIMFHNSGPFWSDPLVWIIFAIAWDIMREKSTETSLASSQSPPQPLLPLQNRELGNSPRG